MKLDIKSILILFLLGFSLFFGYMWYFRGDKGYKERLNQLQERNISIQREKDSLVKILKVKEIEFVKLQRSESLLLSQIANLQVEIKNAKNNANRSKSELDRIRKDLADTRRRIEELKKNPPNRTGDDLINSIKIKTTR